eukprot:scaffold1387_cov382-Prasinococcus_capsulatus_cf.AAC.14
MAPPARPLAFRHRPIPSPSSRLRGPRSCQPRGRERPAYTYHRLCRAPGRRPGMRSTYQRQFWREALPAAPRPWRRRTRPPQRASCPVPRRD